MIEINNFDVLDKLLEYWLQGQTHSTPEEPEIDVHQNLNSTQTCDDLFVTSQISASKLVEIVENHARHCPSKLSVFRSNKRGHVKLLKLRCHSIVHKHHSYWWSSSPKLPDQSYLVNARVNHGLVASGMRPSHYARFVTGAGIGCISKKQRRDFLGQLKPCIDIQYEDSTETALLEEVAMYSFPTIEEDMDVDSAHANNEKDSPVNAVLEEAAPSSLPTSDENLESTNKNYWPRIDIKTDARHGHRKNAKDSSVVAIGDQTNKVLCHVHVKKYEDDQVTQRHEKIGTERIYEYLASRDVDVRTHVHDRNLSINKYVRENTAAVNQNDSWHGIKGLKKNVAEVGSGPKKYHNIKWHKQLEGKEEPVGTHAHWAIQHCQENAELLRSKLLNCIEHYKGNHTDCSGTSRCKLDPAYEPSRTPITEEKAEDLLKNAISSSTLYKGAEDFVLGKNTSHVESFNNTMNMFHDKRIYYGDMEYEVRSQYAVMHWNENVGRPYTSKWVPKSQTPGTRQTLRRRNYMDAKYMCRDQVWKTFVRDMYKERV